MKDYEEEYSLKGEETLDQFVSDVRRTPGEQWMEYGPQNYLPPVEVEVVRRVHEIPLDSNEGIYVRDIRTGSVKAIIGQTYMLQPHEQLYEIELPKAVEDLLPKGSDGTIDKTRVITYRCPFNSAIQIYDYKKKKSRIVFGPELVMLSCCSQMKSSLLTSCLEESQRYQELSNHSRSSSVLISHQISLRSRLPITLD